jgi:cytosine/adenosine deaminase-related metal-dependent hydrolase
MEKAKIKRTLIKNADWIITMDAQKRRLKYADILIEGREIKRIGKALSDEGVDQVIDAKGKVIIPGLVNTHHHCWQSLARNLTVCNNINLEPWLDIIYALSFEITPEVMEASTYVALGDLLKTGCTTSNDLHFAFPKDKPYKNEFIDEEIKAAAKIGMRFHPTRGSMTLGKSQGSDIPDILAEDEDDVLQDSERLFKTYHDMSKFSMCRLGVSPDWHGLDSTERVQVESLELARKYGGHWHSHLCESRFELVDTQNKYGLKPVEYVKKLGLLGPDVYYAHCVQFEDSDLELFAETGTGVAHCPKSNMFLNNGVARIPELRKLGGSVGLAVDGAASNNDSNMIMEMRVAYLAHQLMAHERGGGMTTQDVLEMATVGGAKVLGRDDIGYLAPGMAADLVLMDWSQLQYAGGKYDPVSTIVLSGDARMVDTVLVNGEIVVKGGSLTTINEKDTHDWVDAVGRELVLKASKHVDGLAQEFEIE